MNLYDTFEAKCILCVIIQDGHSLTYYTESRERWRLYFSLLKDSFALGLGLGVRVRVTTSQKHLWC